MYAKIYYADDKMHPHKEFLVFLKKIKPTRSSIDSNPRDPFLYPFCPSISQTKTDSHGDHHLRANSPRRDSFTTQNYFSLL